MSDYSYPCYCESSQNALSFDQATGLINGNVTAIGLFRSIKDVNSRIPNILMSFFYILQAKKALLSLIKNNELSPTQIQSLRELEARVDRIREEVRATITQKQFDNAIELIRLCANSKKLNSEILNNFDSKLDIDTTILEMWYKASFDYTILFSKEIRNICLAVRFSGLAMIYQAANAIENSPEALAPESFTNRITANKAKLTINKAYDFCDEILGKANRNKLINLFRDELILGLDGTQLR